MDQLAIRSFSTAVLDLFFPPRCVGCQEFGAWFCEECRDRVSPVGPPLCPRCGRGVRGLNSRRCHSCRGRTFQVQQIRSVAYSEGVLREAIHAFKYDGITALAAPLADLMADYWKDHPMAIDVAVPVPLHRSRERGRGFNQAVHLARELSARVGITVDEGILMRHRRTAAQVSLDVTERQQNVRDAFTCVGQGAAGKDVLLIDDVCTTGSTLEACAVALRRGGARSVRALTLARAR